MLKRNEPICVWVCTLRIMYIYRNYICDYTFCQNPSDESDRVTRRIWMKCVKKRNALRWIINKKRKEKTRWMYCVAIEQLNRREFETCYYVNDAKKTNNVKRRWIIFKHWQWQKQRRCWMLAQNKTKKKK